MTDQDRNVTEDELHAYVDGELPGGAARCVEAWLAAHPDDAARVAAWRSQAELIRARYGAVANEKTPRAAQCRAACVPRAVSGVGRGRRLRPSSPPSSPAAPPAGLRAAPRPRRPSDLRRFTADALEAYRLYVVEVRHPVEVPGDQRPHLVQWLSKRLGSPLRAPELEKMGLKLVGGRLLPGPTGASAFFMYEAASGERFTLYCGHTSDQETALRYTPAESQRRVLLGGPQPVLRAQRAGGARTSSHAIAQAAYDQIDLRTPPQGG